ncbi:hypothetical protein [Desulfonatronum thiodismutans]|uniref:hypothetical protein n=1 Tax=Desulfonatronum thiodismutans TaxID=159290 RepID=UPI0004ABE874|nr:hypothetical protein [Desulfonatronum thiodismutans]
MLIVNVFFAILTQGLRSGRLTVSDERTTPIDELPDACIGWTAGEGEAMLHPERTMDVVKRLTEEGGITFEVKPRLLWKRVAEAGLIVGSEKDRNSRKITVGGKYQKVVHVWLTRPELPTATAQEVEAPEVNPAAQVVTEPAADPAADTDQHKAMKRAVAWIKPRIHSLKQAGWTAQALFHGPDSLVRSPYWERATEAKIYPGGIVGFEVPGPIYSSIVNVRPPFEARRRRT